MYGKMARFVEVDAVIYLVCTSIFYLDNVMRIQFFSIKQMFTAAWANSVLFLGYFVKFRIFNPTGFSVPSGSVLPVFTQCGVIR